MKLLTRVIESKLRKAPIYSTEKQDIAPVLVKFFTPDSLWTWYVLEAEFIPIDGWNFFGLVDGHEKELGYFTLAELESIRGPLHLKVERDMYFDGMAIKKSTNEVVRI